MKIANLVKGSAALVMIAALASCGSKSKKEYDLDNSKLIPVKTSDSKYGFMNKNGEIVMSDEFKHKPSAPVNGVFSVSNDDGEYTIYKLNGDKYDEFGSYGKVKGVGVLDEGLLVVAPKDKPMAVLDKNGDEKFIVEISGEEVLATGNRFSDGMLAVQQQTDGLWGYIDKNGEVIIKPAYDSAEPFLKGKALVSKNEKDGNEYKTVYTVIDKKGEPVLKVKDKYSNVYTSPVYDGLIVSSVDGDNTTWYLIDFKGEEKVKFPEKVQAIQDFDGKNIIYVNDGLYGAMNLKGEDVVKPKYEELAFDGSNFLAGKGEKGEVKSYVILKSNGEETDKTFDTSHMEKVGKHGYFMKDGNTYIFVGDDGKEKNKGNEVKNFYVPSYHYDTISTDKKDKDGNSLSVKSSESNNAAGEE